MWTHLSISTWCGVGVLHPVLGGSSGPNQVWRSSQSSQAPGNPQQVKRGLQDLGVPGGALLGSRHARLSKEPPAQLTCTRLPAQVRTPTEATNPEPSNEGLAPCSSQAPGSLGQRQVWAPGPCAFSSKLLWFGARIRLPLCSAPGDPGSGKLAAYQPPGLPVPRRQDGPDRFGDGLAGGAGSWAGRWLPAPGLGSGWQATLHPPP